MSYMLQQTFAILEIQSGTFLMIALRKLTEARRLIILFLENLIPNVTESHYIQKLLRLHHFHTRIKLQTTSQY